MGRVLLGVAALVALTGCRAGGGEGELTVFAAASLTDAFADIAAAFEDAEGVDVRLELGSSSSLREQILDGAPADVYAAAGAAPMAALVQAGAVGRPHVFAGNRLQLAVPAGNPADVDAIDDLAREELLVGICAPEVPCGDLARRALDAQGVDAAPDTEEPDVRALLTKIAAGELDAGLVYATDVRAADGAVQGIDVGGELATELPIAVVGDDVDGSPAERFVAFVLGDAGQRILADHGFAAP